MPVTSSISALSGIEWTDLNGTGLTSTSQINPQKALVTALGNASTNLNTELANISGGTHAYFELFSDTVVEDYSRYRIGNTDDYAAFSSQAAAQAAIGNFGVASFYNSTTNRVEWVAKTYINSNFSNPQYTVFTGDYDRSYWQRTYGYSSNEVLTGSLSTWLPAATANSVATLAQINTALGLNLTQTTQLSKSQWQEIARDLKAASYKEASKLSVKDGGGLKTYGGYWYANGEKVSYLDIVFAVRINQLFVVNNSISDYLEHVQENNKKIKLANSISAIFSANSPSNSTGAIALYISSVNGATTNTSGAQIVLSALENGFLGAARNNQAEADDWLQWLERKDAVTYTGADGKMWLAYKDWSTGVIGHSLLNNVTKETLSLYNVRAKFDSIINMLPASFSKIFANKSSDNGDVYSFNSGTLSQTDCTTITTELKSYISGIDSDTQLLQTQLSQYNDKRTEVLDDLSSLVKGINGALSDMGRNLSAI